MLSSYINAFPFALWLCIDPNIKNCGWMDGWMDGWTDGLLRGIDG